MLLFEIHMAVASSDTELSTQKIYNTIEWNAPKNKNKATWKRATAKIRTLDTWTTW